LVQSFWNKEIRTRRLKQSQLITEMESVLSARSRLAKYPLLVAECGPQTVKYGRCVGNAFDEVRKHQCSQEFKEMMDCIRKSAKKMKTKI